MNMKPVWAGGFVFVFFLYDLLSTEKGKHWTFWSCTLYYIFPLIKYVKHSKCTVILANTILLYNIFCNNWNLPVYLIQAWRLLCLWQSSAEPKSSKEELYCHLSHVQYTVQMRVCPPWTILCNTDKQQHIQPKVCVCVYLLYMLSLALGGRLAGRRFLNDFPWSPDFLIGIGSQKHSLVKISHRQHILFVLPVYGFTVNATNTLLNTTTSLNSTNIYYVQIFNSATQIWRHSCGQ